MTERNLIGIVDELGEIAGAIRLAEMAIGSADIEREEKTALRIHLYETVQRIDAVSRRIEEGNDRAGKQ